MYKRQAKYIAEKAGVDDFIAEAKPEDKMEYIKKEQQSEMCIRDSPGSPHSKRWILAVCDIQ